jgi:acyl dehydratase
MMPAIAHPAEDSSSGDVGAIEVATSAPLFDEHFETFAVLPGSFSLSLAMLMLYRALDIERARLHGVTLHKVNFTRPVRPGDRLAVRLTRVRRDGAHVIAHIDLRNAADASVMDSVISWEYIT